MSEQAPAAQPAKSAAPAAKSAAPASSSASRGQFNRGPGQGGQGRGGFGGGQGGRGGFGGRGPRRGGDRSPREFEQKTVEVARVTRVVAGGKRMRFRALVVIGDKKGRVGIGVRKGVDVSEAMNKAVNSAKKNMITVPIVNGTIPHEIKLKFKSSVVFLKPAKPGTGVIAGGAIRQVLDMVGVKNVLSKMIGSSNKINNVRATYMALAKMKAKPSSKKQAASEPVKASE